MPAYLLVAKRMGFTVAELDQITIGLFLDACASSGGEAVKEATQADIDRMFPW
ncbi:MAG: hypothetical protein VB034_02515 [Eubacteriales bacterium]|nr:hypothetical protein [Eubacteriales bacterium]